MSRMPPRRTVPRAGERRRSCTSPRPRAWSAISARPTTRPPSSASSACRNRSRSTWTRFNVRSNCISPFAWSRMIGTIPTETEAEKARVESIQQMGPEKIAPSSRLPARATPPRMSPGRSSRVRMNEIFLMSQSRPLRSVHRGEGWTPQTIAEHAHAGAEVVVLQARSLRRHLQLGRDLKSKTRSI